jgi:hypothetical protein
VRKSCITYHVDTADRIVFVSDTWEAFAEANGTDYLTTDYILNKTLFSFIADMETRHIYEMLIKRCRDENEQVNFTFRCDGPDVRRYMSMEISPLDDGNIKFHSCIHEEEYRPPVELLDSSIDRSNELLKICSWCKKVEVEPGEWHEVEEAVKRLALFDAKALPGLTHGICVPCFETVEKKWA